MTEAITHTQKTLLKNLLSPSISTSYLLLLDGVKRTEFLSGSFDFDISILQLKKAYEDGSTRNGNTAPRSIKLYLQYTCKT